MNYCSHCGSDQIDERIPEGDHKARNICTNCSTIHYSNPLMVVGCLIVHKGKVLLARRGIEPRKGYWNLPCGFMENGETAEEGAVREVYEETGLSVEIGPLHSVFSVVHAQQVYMIFHASTNSTGYTLTPESVEIDFFEPSDIPWEEIAFSSNVHALRSYLDKPGSVNVHLGSYNRS